MNRRPGRRLRGILTVLAMLPAMAAPAATQDTRPPGWTEASHGNRVPANYEVVLPDGHVNEITIVFRAGDWSAVMDNMSELLGEHGVETEFMRAIAGLFGQGERSCAGGIEQAFGWALVMNHGVDMQALREACLLYTSPSPRDGLLSRMPSSA